MSKLPKGYLIEEDPAGRVLLKRQGWKNAVIFFSEESAIKYALFLEREFYKTVPQEETIIVIDEAASIDLEAYNALLQR